MRKTIAASLLMLAAAPVLAADGTYEHLATTSGTQAAHPGVPSRHAAVVATSADYQSTDGQSAARLPDLSAEQVRLVQRSLRDRGFAVNVTGVIDDQTRTALTDFQRAHRLVPSGRLDSPTTEALGVDPRDVRAARGEGDDRDAGRKAERDAEFLNQVHTAP
jgi:peptidoglycan hydrolase-like protein with peptidoglycan-binding domain